MADCCGGKNAGKRISWRRYAAGLGVFLGYHGTVMVALHAAALPLPRLRKVRDFQRDLFFSELREILQLEDINVNGRLDGVFQKVCEIDDGPSVMAVPMDSPETPPLRVVRTGT